MMTHAIEAFERKQARAKTARAEARDLRDLHGAATCGLRMQFTGVHYGLRGVPEHIARRVADMYLIWADEYDVVADALERELAAALGETTESETPNV